MRTKASAGAALLALAMLGGCYWTASREDGAATVTASLPRSVIVRPTGYTMRAYLYAARSVSVTYYDASGKPTIDPAQIADAVVVPSGKPIPLDGQPYWEVQIDLRAPTSGSFTIVGVPADVRCRLHLRLLDWSAGGSVVAEGLSKEFVVAAGESAGLAVDLY